MNPPPDRALGITAEHSPGLPEWLAARQVSLVVTNYQRHRLLVVGQSQGRLKVVERVFDRPLGIYADEQRIWVATRYHLWRLENVLEDGDRDQAHDRVFVPLEACTTGQLDIHDLSLDRSGQPVFVNTAYSCLACASQTDSFRPLWKPAFISQLQAEDRCHLNGMAMLDGKPRFATAVARSDLAGGWRNERLGGGAVFDVASGEVIAKDLSMPHSPRWHDGQLWLLNAGCGELGRLHGSAGGYEPVVKLPGFTRGLDFVGGVAVVGVSKGRERAFENLEFSARLDRDARSAECGAFFVDTERRVVEHWLRFEGAIEEISDLAIIPGCSRPNVIGFQGPEVRSLVTFEVEGRGCRHRNAVELGVGPDPFLPLRATPNAGAGPSVPAGGAEETESGKPSEPGESKVWISSVGDLLGSVLDQTFPNLRRLTQVRPLGKELLAVSLPTRAASGDGVATHIGALALVELGADNHLGEILSFWVRPDLRSAGWGQRLLEETERAAKSHGVQAVGAKLRSTWKNCGTVERLLVRAGWSEPEARQVACRFDMEEFLRLNDEAPREPLPASFSVVPWNSISESQREGIRQKQRKAEAGGRRWFPSQLSPFQLEDTQVQQGPSKALLFGGEVAGWMTSHLTAPDTLQYTALFVDPGLRKQYLAVELAGVVFHEQKDLYLLTRPAGLRWGVFLTEASNVALLQWIESRIRKYKPVVSELRWSEKTLEESR